METICYSMLEITHHSFINDERWFINSCYETANIWCLVLNELRAQKHFSCRENKCNIFRSTVFGLVCCSWLGLSRLPRLHVATSHYFTPSSFSLLKVIHCCQVSANHLRCGGKVSACMETVCINWSSCYLSCYFPGTDRSQVLVLYKLISFLEHLILQSRLVLQ